MNSNRLGYPVPLVITRKLMSFLKDPMGGFLFYGRTFGERVRPWLEKCLIVWSKYQLYRNGLLTLLSNRPQSAYAPNCEDLWFLYRLVRRRKRQTDNDDRRW